jgi:hypothetical protein
MSDLALAPDTWVIIARQLGRIVRAHRFGSVSGYDVQVVPETRLEGWAPHFADAWIVKPAVVGVNVCTERRGQCSCALVHAPHPEWLPTTDHLEGAPTNA